MDQKLKRLTKGLTVQFTRDQLHDLESEYGHLFDIHISKKIKSALKSGKGVRIALSEHEIKSFSNDNDDMDEEDMDMDEEGGKIKFKKAFKSVSKAIKKDVKSAVKYVGDTEKRQYGKKIVGAINQQNKYGQKLNNIIQSKYVPLPDEFKDAVGMVADYQDKGVGAINRIHKARQEGNVKGMLSNVVKDQVKSQGKEFIKSQVRGQMSEPRPMSAPNGGSLRSNIVTAKMRMNGGSSCCHYCGGSFKFGGSFRSNDGGSFKSNGGSFKAGALYEDNSVMLRHDMPGFHPRDKLVNLKYY